MHFQVVVLDRKKIVKNYLTGWFVPDFVASVPFVILLAGSRYMSLPRIHFYDPVV